MLRTDAIANYLKVSTFADLAKLYTPDMEVQVNVAKDNGKLVEGGDFRGRASRAWTDDVTTWYPFRIPLHANTETPEFNNHEMTFSIEQHAEGIGMTGWDFKNKVSRWVAFDFDAITGHSDRHSKKLTEQQLSEVRDAVNKLPWTTLRLSTSGKGLHLYVFLNSVPTSTHTEHAALARSVLGMMCGITGFDFANTVDVCGGNMWVWHRKMRGTDGLKLIKEGTILTSIPTNWRDHVPVINRKHKKAQAHFVRELNVNDPESLFDELSGQRSKVPLDEDHKKLIEFLGNQGGAWWWDNDNWMLVCHTFDLKQAHTHLNMRGKFETISTGTEHGSDHNCFCFGGNTLVLTKDGPKTFKELAAVGEAELYVHTPAGMQWIKAPIKSFGLQETVAVNFGDGWSCRATNNHRWLWINHKKQISSYSDGLDTYQLKVGKTQLPYAPIKLDGIDEEAYAHGFVYGDGWIENRDSNCTVAFFGEKRALIPLIQKFGYLGDQTYNGTVETVCRMLPKHWKFLPENPSRKYALSFILGLLSADGFMHPTLGQINQSGSEDEIVELRNLAIYAGLRCTPHYQVNPSAGSYPNAQPAWRFSFSVYNLQDFHILRKDQKKAFKRKVKDTATTVSSFGWITREEVFCAEVPKFFNFTLANGVITGNCFPNRHGVWSVRRFSMGVKESDTWEQDGKGWTRCFLNRDPDLGSVSRIYNGVEHERGGYVFTDFETASKALADLKVDFGTLPPWIMNRKTTIKPLRAEGKIVVHIEAVDGVDQPGGPMRRWLLEKKLWKRIFNVSLPKANEADAAENYDDLVRHISSESGNDMGWIIRRDNQWADEPLIHIKTLLRSYGHDEDALNTILGKSILGPWRVVNKPFQSEYPGDREWNRNAPQFTVPPIADTDNLSYPTWLKVLDHCGKNLDEPIKEHEWCRANGISTGADYLKLWLACLIKRPDQPSPYLAFWGGQDCGKSTFHEMLPLIITNGIISGDAALSNNSGFNGELANALVCYVEETDLKKNKVAYNRIKDWVTSPRMLLHIKRETPIQVPNYTHWIQTSNDQSACPIFPGDTRITLIRVNALPRDQLIGKRQLMEQLRKEAPDFLASLLMLEIPEIKDRLIMPVIETQDKIEAEQRNMNLLETFIDQKCFRIPGQMVKADEFIERFHLWLAETSPSDINYWSKNQVGRQLSSEFPRGRMGAKDMAIHYGNMSFDPEAAPGQKLIVKNLYLKPEGS